MIISLAPNLEGLAERRFFSFARQVRDQQSAGDPLRISALVETETARAANLSVIKGQCAEYTACVRVLGDLAQLRWKLVESGYGLELHSPRPHDDRASDSVQSRARKDAIRNELRPRVMEQFDGHVRKFIRRMESPPVSAKQKSIRMLIADGAELQQRLRKAWVLRADDPCRFEALHQAVSPYLQLVEDSIRDNWTGILLRDIWRYFRYTWSIPQTSIPGRRLLYLVRDAAHASHAVIGIAALSNCAVKLTPRDRAIGWSASGLVAALKALFVPHGQQAAYERSDPALRLQGVYQSLKPHFPTGADPSAEDKRVALRATAEWLVQGISTAIGEIESRGLVTAEEIAAPTTDVIGRLRHLSLEFAVRRQDVLAGRGNMPGDISDDVPVDDDVLALEAKHTSNTPVHHSRRMLVRKKRAFELARLLDASRVLTASMEDLTSPDTALSTIDREEVRTAVNTAMSAIKGRRIGTNLLEITTCGAVAPYNRMLGGKLVALLLLSPQVAADNRRRYGNEPTIIRSQLKNNRVVPDNTVVWLGTTSLYSHGSSQYERLRLPAGVIAADQPEIRYTYLGDTTGYGTVQFADDTVRALDGMLRGRRGYRDVNGVFGEGASPRLRKLRSGLDALGFDAELTMLHHRGRRIYGVPLFGEAGAFLCGLGTDVPDYVAAPQSYPDATERIAEFWRRRWLSSRLAHADSWTALGEIRPWLLSSTIPLRQPPPGAGKGSRAQVPDGPAENASAGNGGEPTEAALRDEGDDEDRLAFWRRLACAGSNAVSEGLTDAEFETLHIWTPLDKYLFHLAHVGLTIVLTGNAGDGKTHLARNLKRQLKCHADRFEFAFDATAIMNKDEGVDPIVERWRQARNAGKRMVIAINQYPLYLLRQRLRDTLPDVSEEIERQWNARLTAEDGDDDADTSSAVDSVLLVDLSLRNPLSHQFASKVLKKMLSDPAIRRHAESGNDPNFSFNFERLANTTVQKRLYELFGRVISSGRRTTIRELWILIARLLFGTSTVETTPGALDTWYSERLFADDPRFPLIEALRRVADPAGVSHPHIDRRLESPQGTKSEEWFVGDGPPDRLPSPATGLGQTGDKYRQRFRAHKRRFYFEHTDGGGSIFKLDPDSNAQFHKMLQEPDNDAEHLRLLVETINRCYFPHHFDGIKDMLCLWIGHRLDEEPTKSFVAGEYIPREHLRIRRPQPPRSLREAFEYVPDHLILSGTDPAKKLLRIDAALFRTLSLIHGGLPRHLINPGELNRLDTAVDRLRRMAPLTLPEFLIYNAEHVTSSAVKMSANFATYSYARRL